jgi:hypothetical protein
VGDPIVEDLNNRGIRLEAYKFTEQTRKDLLTNMALKLEQRTVKLLDHDVLKQEMSYFQYELGNQGKLKIKVPDGLHDDCPFATALSMHNLPSQPIRQNRYNQTSMGVTSISEFSL